MDEQYNHQELEEAYQHAKETAEELGELSRDEAENIAHYVKRDLQHAAQYIIDTEQGLAKWLQFDIELIEDRLWEIFSKAADKTKVDMLKFQIRMSRGPVYKTGELVGMGTLQCDNCGELVKFTEVSEIAKCTECGGKTFSRVNH